MTATIEKLKSEVELLRTERIALLEAKDKVKKEILELQEKIKPEEENLERTTR